MCCTSPSSASDSAQARRERLEAVIADLVRGTEHDVFAKEKGIPVYVHAIDMNRDGKMDVDSEVTQTYFFLDKQFAINKLCVHLIEIVREGLSWSHLENMKKDDDPFIGT